MDVCVLLFAGLRQAIGASQLVIELPAGATVESLRCRLTEDWPIARELLQRTLFAVGNEYAADGRILHHGCEIAAIPPVSGG